MGPRRKIVRLLLSVVMAFAATAGLAGSAHADVSDPAGYYHLKVSHPISTCVDAQDAPSGTQLVMWSCVNSDYEEWAKIQEPVPGNRYEHCACTTATMFVNEAMNLCLAVQNNTDDRPDTGTPVVQAECNANDEKQYWILPNLTIGEGAGIGGGKIQSFTLLDKVLDVTGSNSANGTPLQVYTSNLTAAQLWGPPAGCTCDQ